MYIQYIQGLCQSRLSTANHDLSLVAPATTALYSLETDYALNFASLITPRHRQRRKHSDCIFVPIISMGTCLFAKASPSNGRVYLFIKNLLPKSEWFFVFCFEVATQQRLYTLQYFLLYRNLKVSHRVHKSLFSNFESKPA
jgi:hypothetical protein